LLRLAQSTSSSAIAPEQQEDLRRLLQSRYRDFRLITAEKLEQMAATASRLEDTRSHARELRMHVRALLSTEWHDSSAPIAAAEGVLMVMDRLLAVTEEKVSCSYVPVVEAVLRGLETTFDQEDVAVVADVPLGSRAKVWIQEHDLATVLGYVIGNSTEALRSQAERRLSIAAVEDARWVKIEIADTGCGLPAVAAEELFERGFTTKRRGTGFGLYHARQILTRCGGEIRLRSRTDAAGTRVTIRLRRTRATGSGADHGSRISQASEKPKDDLRERKQTQPT
jgi:signal transduction histidine kinase